MKVFSDDPDALEVVVDSAPLVQTGSLTLTGQGFLSISGTLQAAASVTFTGQGFLRFPSNEKVACEVLVCDDQLLGVEVCDDSLLTVCVLEDKDVDF